MLHGDVLRPLTRMKTEPNQLLRYSVVIAEKARRLHSIHYVYLTLERVAPTGVCLPTAPHERTEWRQAMLADVLQRETGYSTQQPRVLIVEDEFLIAMDIEDSIMQAEDEANVIGIANRLEDAIALGRSADVAFVDVNLADGQTGPEIGRRLSESGVVVIFMTANPEVVVNLGVGAGVISKPVPQDAVEQCLAYAIAKRAGTHAVTPIGMMPFE